MCILILQAGQALLYCIFYTSIQHLPSIWICMQATSSPQFQYGCCAACLISASAVGRVLFICVLWHTIYHCKLMSDGPIFLYVLCHIVVFVWPTLYDITLSGVYLWLFLLVYLTWMDTLTGPMLC